jgi:hypothetical protein
MGAQVEAGQEPDMPGLAAKYGMEFDFESIPRICEEHGLTHPLLEQLQA